MTPTISSAVQLWKRLPEAIRLQAAEAFWLEDDGVEQQVEAMALLARHMKARPKFIAGLPAERRARYLAHHPALPEALAARLLVSYHLAHQRPMLRAFLDALGIAHDNGLITADPEGPIPQETLDAAARQLDEAFPPADVTVYLTTLRTQDPATWQALDHVPQATRDI